MVLLSQHSQSSWGDRQEYNSHIHRDHVDVWQRNSNGQRVMGELTKYDSQEDFPEERNDFG